MNTTAETLRWVTRMVRHQEKKTRTETRTRMVNILNVMTLMVIV